MKGPSLTSVRKYIAAIKKSPRKYLTSEHLSKELGVFPDVINETLSYFNPLVTMDFTFDIRPLLPLMEVYAAELFARSKETAAPHIIVTKKNISDYESISDFILKKMVFTSGLFDRNAHLSDTDLRVLKKLIAAEQAERRGKKPRK